MDKVLNAPTHRERIMTKLATPRPTENEENSPAVLPADHPLLEKFQRALKEHLLKVNSKLREEISEIDESIDRMNKQREDIGVKLYDYQQEIEHQKDVLDEYNKQILEVSERRINYEKDTSELQKEHDSIENEYKEKKRIYNEHLIELDNIQMLEKSMEKWALEAEDDMMAAKRAINTDMKNRRDMTHKKKMLDFAVFKLDTEVRKRERELEDIVAQQKDKKETIKILNQKLVDANTDLETIRMDHRRLISAWNEVIFIIHQRDKNLAKLKSDLDLELQNHKNIDSNIEGTKKSSRKEMEQNEKLELFKTKVSNDIDHLEKQLEAENEKNNKLTIDIETKTAILDQTESDLNKAQTEGTILENQLKILRKKMEKQALEKVMLEEKMLELLQDQISTDQASGNRTKNLRDLQEKRRSMEILMLTTEHQLTKVLFDMEKWKEMVNNYKDNNEKMIQKKEGEAKILNGLLAETANLRHSIQLKSKAVDRLNKQLDFHIQATGGKELDPNELKIVETEKNLHELDCEIRNLQNFWLRLQRDVVNNSDKRADQMNNIHLYRTQLLVIEQKTLQIDTELEALLKQDHEIVKELKLYNIQLDKLTSKLYDKKKYENDERDQFEMRQSQLLDDLKEGEMSIIKLEQELVERQKEIDENKEIVLEKHREALSWETKWKMAMETKKFRDKEYSASSEIGAMKAEIHRMEVRFQQLKRAQEKLAQDLENCVSHRDHIFDNATTRCKMSDQKAKTRFTIFHRINEMKNKIRSIHAERNTVERNIRIRDGERDKLKEKVKLLNNQADEEKLQDSLTRMDIENGLLAKQENLDLILKVQHRAKRYRNLCKCNNLPKYRGDEYMTNELDRQKEIMENLKEILEQLIIEFPDHSLNLRRICNALKSDDDI